MSRSIQFNFSHLFDGVIWNIRASDGERILVIEVRNHDRHVVHFTAFNYETQVFRWRDKVLEEKWWINLIGATEDKAFFTLYTDTNNPDQKAALAYRISNDKLLWWNNDFSIEKVTPRFVFGTTMRMGTRKLILDAETGAEYALDHMDDVRIEEKVQHPHQYPADHPYFATVAKFFSQKFNLLPTTALEYLEHDSLIFISCYFQENDLVNYMFVLSPDGDLLLKEKLGERLKGIGLDTFFILSGCLFFVRNKGELVSYKIL